MSAHSGYVHPVSAKLVYKTNYIAITPLGELPLTNTWKMTLLVDNFIFVSIPPDTYYLYVCLHMQWKSTMPTGTAINLIVVFVVLKEKILRHWTST